MPVTTEQVSARYALRDGERWWTCGRCGRVLGKVMPDGRLQQKIGDGWQYVEPTPAATVVVLCNCTDPPFREVYMLNT